LPSLLSLTSSMDQHLGSPLEPNPHSECGSASWCNNWPCFLSMLQNKFLMPVFQEHKPFFWQCKLLMFKYVLYFKLFVALQALPAVGIFGEMSICFYICFSFRQRSPPWLSIPTGRIWPPTQPTRTNSPSGRQGTQLTPPVILQQTASSTVNIL